MDYKNYKDFNLGSMGLLNAPQPNIYIDPLKVQQAQKDITDNEYENLAKRKKYGNLMLALSDVLKGRDPGPGVLQRQQAFQQEQLLEEAKRKQEILGKSAGAYLRSLGANEEMISLATSSPELATQILSQQFAGEKKPASVQEYEFARSQGFKGTYADFRQSKSPVVNINQLGQSEFIKSAIELGTEDLKETRKLVQTSSELLPKLETAQIIVQNPDFKTGPSQEMTLDLRRLYNDITGRSQERVTQQELFNALSNYTIPRMRPPGSGATSDFEASLFTRATIGLQNTKEGNELLLGTMVQQAKRDRILLKLKEEYWKNNEGDTSGFSAYLEENDLVPPLYQQIDLSVQNIGELYDQRKIKNGEVYVDITDPIYPQLRVFRLSDFQ